MDKHGKRSASRRAAWWALIAVSAGAVAFIWAVVSTGRAWERVHDWTDGEDADPGLLRVYAPAGEKAAGEDGDRR